MTTHAKKIEVVTTAIEAKPGSLAKIYGALREAGVNMITSWAYEMGPGEANAHFYSNDANKVKDVLTKLGLKPTVDVAAYVEGDDKAGAYAEALTKIAKAGVNVHATDAFGVGGKFASVFFAEAKDVDTICKVIA
jgi:hypothetical protein